MRTREVKIGSTYIANVSGQRVRVTITSKSVYKGWYARNERTGRTVRILTGRRLICEAERKVTE